MRPVNVHGIPANVPRSQAIFRPGQPLANTTYCFKCDCWKASFPTKVVGQGWTVCSQCHTCDWTEDFDYVPWEDRVIRLLGVAGDNKYERLHRQVKGE
jgi:hypothetical protein